MLPASHTPYPLQSARVRCRSEVSHGMSASVWDDPFRRLPLFGHIGRAGPEMDHCRVLSTPPSTTLHGEDPGTLHTWTRTVEADLKPCNNGLHSAWHRAQDRNAWSRLVQTAMPQSGVRSWWWWYPRVGLFVNIQSYNIVLINDLSQLLHSPWSESLSEATECKNWWMHKPIKARNSAISFGIA